MTILAFGDSLTAGYGLEQGRSFADRLEEFLQARGVEVDVVNAGISGDTSAGGRGRIAWSLQESSPDLVVLELGANDGLRGLDPGAMEDNLRAIIQACLQRGSQVLLTGMVAPQNMGKSYKNDYDAVFPRLAKDFDLPFYPFFLEGVAGRAELNLRDGIHPNDKGIAVIVSGIGPQVLEVLKSMSRD